MPTTHNPLINLVSSSNPRAPSTVGHLQSLQSHSQMKLTLPSVFLLLAAVVSARVHSARQQCPEAARFGEVSITPSTVSPGDVGPSSLLTLNWNADGYGQIVSVKADFTCSFSFGIRPNFTDYHIEVPVNNNGHEPPILLARRQPFVTPASPIDQFEVQVSIIVYPRPSRSSLQLYLFRSHSHPMLLVQITSWI